MQGESCDSRGVADRYVVELTVERERRPTSDLKQRFLAAATLTVSFCRPGLNYAFTAMNPYKTTEDSFKAEDSLRTKKTVSRITLLEVLIAVAIIAALIAWLPKEWSR